MSIQKKSSKILDEAKQRIAGLQNIETFPDLGNDLSMANFETEADGLEEALDKHNNLLSKVDASITNIRTLEKKLKQRTTRMREAIGGLFGHESKEYENAGGIPDSKRKRPGPKSSTKTPSDK